MDPCSITKAVVEQLQLEVVERLESDLLDKFTKKLSERQLISPFVIHPSGSDGEEVIKTTIGLIWEAMLNASLRHFGESGPQAAVGKLMLEGRMTARTWAAYNRAVRNLRDFMVEHVAKERRRRPDGNDLVMWDDDQAGKVITEVCIILAEILKDEETVISQDTPMEDQGQ
ncbi:hypothetical protein MAJ_09172, partial [Metarhizium majus ARSEF 297]